MGSLLCASWTSLVAENSLMSPSPLVAISEEGRGEQSMGDVKATGFLVHTGEGRLLVLQGLQHHLHAACRVIVCDAPCPSTAGRRTCSLRTVRR